MSIRIDDLLASVRIATSSAGFDVGAGLRRLATEVEQAAMATPAMGLTQADQARQRLDVISRWVLNKPDAAARFARLAEEPATQSQQAAEEHLDIEGALVFACLLYLTGHPDSAQFWWQLAAGAGHRSAAYCLHLHHLELGEPRESRHWLHQATREPTEPATTPPVEDFYDVLEVFARYARRHGSSARVPTESLAAEIDRLAAHSAYGCVIIARPDRRLAQRLHDVAGRR